MSDQTQVRPICYCEERSEGQYDLALWQLAKHLASNEKVVLGELGYLCPEFIEVLWAWQS